MILVFIENRTYLTKVLSYLDELKIPYTTDIHADYETIVFAEFSNKVESLIEENPNKKYILLGELEEKKMLHHLSQNTKIGKKYVLRMKQMCNHCNRIIVTMPSLIPILKKKLKREVVCIPRELPMINISKSNKDIYDKYHLSKKYKQIVIIDYHYSHLDQVTSLALEYPKYQFLLIGYQPEYLLSKKNKELYLRLPSNIISQKYIDFNIYSDLCKVSWLVIFFFDDALDNDFLSITLLFKKQLLMEYHPYYQNYLVNSKNVYLFQNKEELQLRFKKIVENRVSNLTDQGYDLISLSTYKEILKKWNQNLRI